jgi:hypothetical protein
MRIMGAPPDRSRDAAGRRILAEASLLSSAPSLPVKASSRPAAGYVYV